MTQNRKMAWVVIWGSALLLCLITVFFPAKKKEPAKAASEAPAQDLGLGNRAVSVKENGKATLLEWRRDPFVLEERSLPSGGSRLTGIIFDENQQAQSYAIIDEQLVKVGDQVNGWKVLKINKNSVDIESDGRKEELFLNQ